MLREFNIRELVIVLSFSETVRTVCRGFRTEYRWRLANVIPVFKKCISSNVANYRPISLTSTFSKIFERIVKQQC